MPATTINQYLNQIQMTSQKVTNIEQLTPLMEVKHKGHTYLLISVNLGGKCKLRKKLLPFKGRVLDEVDFKELEIEIQPAKKKFIGIAPGLSDDKLQDNYN